jgi:hypothetical protein
MAEKVVAVARNKCSPTAEIILHELDSFQEISNGLSLLTDA